MKKKRILFGAIDTGYRIECYSKYINTYLSNKLIPESFSKYVLPSSHYKTSYTYSCSIDKHSKIYVYIYTFFFFIYSLFRYDIFHFISGETILTWKLRKLELKIYKLFRKRIIFHFVGADIRSVDYLIWKNENLAEYLSNKTDRKQTTKIQDKLVKIALKYADEIIVSTPDLLKIIPQAKYYPVMIDYDKFFSEMEKIKDKRIDNPITVLHVPSNAPLKGTKTIEKIFYYLKDEFKERVNFVLEKKTKTDGTVYSMDRYQLFSHLKKSHILIDQITIGWYGLQSIEGLLSGNITLCYIEEDIEKYLFDQCPIINVNALNLQDKLFNIIKNYKKLSEAQYNSILLWVKKNHTIEENNQVIINAWAV